MSKKRLYNCAGRLYLIPEDKYKEYKKDDNHAYYIKQHENDVVVLSFDALDTDEFVGADILVDHSVNVEDEAINNILIGKLKYCLTMLTDDELYLVEQLIYNEKSERDLSDIIGVPQKTINDRKRRVLAKLDSVDIKLS